MKLSAVLFLTAMSLALAGSVTVKTLVFPSKTSTSYVEMVPLKPLSLTAFTLCMRVATELSGNREVILFAYRTQPHDELNVWRESNGRLGLYLAGKGVLFSVPQLGALETHLCVTWDSSTGATTFFMNGRKSLTKIYKKGHTIRSGGKVLIGQDADRYLGSFDANQCFIGEIGDINMWDYVLSDSTIQHMSSEHGILGGNVFDWHIAQLRFRGNVKMISHEL